MQCLLRRLLLVMILGTCRRMLHPPAARRAMAEIQSQQQCDNETVCNEQLAGTAKTMLMAVNEPTRTSATLMPGPPPPPPQTRSST